MKIETARLTLREFLPTDWPAVLAYQSDPRYLRYYAWESRTRDQVEAFVAMFVRNQQAHPRLKFQIAVTLRSDGRLIGNCGVRLPSPDSRVADLGYELAPDEWGNGYATEAALAMRDFAFATLGVHRLWASCVADNLGSARVLSRLGMRQEAHLRETAHYKGRWWDELIFAMLESEWQS